MRGQERSPCATATSVNSCAGTEQRDAATGERIVGAALGHQQRRTRIALQVLGMFGECADEEDRVTLVKATVTNEP